MAKTCLAVDDSALVRKIARQILTSMAFEVKEAENGKVALEVCEDQMPDAILLDWNMPVMDGMEFLGKLRQLPGGANPVVVLCTTNNEIHHIETALKAGADEFIMKPFDADIVETKFRQVGLV